MAITGWYGQTITFTVSNTVDAGLRTIVASVGGGIPVVRTLRDALACDSIVSLSGIVNGTCNYVLTRMRMEGLGFDEVVKDAQRLGYAEADPGLDVDGGDSARRRCRFRRRTRIELTDCSKGSYARVRDGDATVRGATAVAKDVADARALVGADPEDDEAEAEDECEEDEHPLRVASQPREEEGVLDRYEVAVALGAAGCSIRPRAADAASISSCHSDPPLSYLASPSTRVARTRSGAPP